MELEKQRTETGLSQLRTALLNWYPFTPGSRALLLGANTAPLLPLLRKSYPAVDTSFEVGSRYDCITAVDLVEQAEDPAALLQRLERSLAEDGVLLLVFRNRFGLKYLCGGVDAFVKSPFATLQPASAAPRLYAKNEMSALLSQSGFAPPRFYYLMPDADFVQAVYTDEHLPDDSIRDRVFPFDLHESPLVAWEGDLYDELVREGALPLAANVFLAECRRPGAAAPDKQVAYAALSTDRGERNGFATVLYDNGTACKMPLSPEGFATLEELCANMAALSSRGILTVPHTLTPRGIEMPCIREEGLLHYLRRQLPAHPEAFLHVFDLIWEDVLRSSPSAEELPEDMAEIWGADPARLGPILKSALIDMIPYNAFWAGGKLRYYDQEFRVENCPAGYVLFRALRYTWLHIPEAERTIPLRDIKARYGLAACWKGFQAREDRFVAANRNHKALQEIYRHSQPDREAMLQRRRALDLIAFA